MMESVSMLVGELILRQWPHQMLHFKLSAELFFYFFFLQNRVHLIITLQWWKCGHVCDAVRTHYN